jgi:hypothetical protein
MVETETITKKHFMTKEMKIQMLADFYKSYPDGSLETESNSIGHGQWSISVYGWMSNDSKEYLFDLVGSNGTQCEEDDLWSELDEILNSANSIVESL